MSRFLLGIGLLAAVGFAIGGTAAAQRFERIEKVKRGSHDSRTPISANDRTWTFFSSL